MCMLFLRHPSSTDSLLQVSWDLCCKSSVFLLEIEPFALSLTNDWQAEEGLEKLKKIEDRLEGDSS